MAKARYKKPRAVTVAQLIAQLQAMPPSAEVLTITQLGLRPAHVLQPRHDSTEVHVLGCIAELPRT